MIPEAVSQVPLSDEFLARLSERPDLQRQLGFLPGGGGGSNGGMETRIGRLEDDMKEVRSDIKGLRRDIADLRADVAELKGRVVMLPGYGGIALIVGLIVALSTAAQIGVRFLP